MSDARGFLTETDEEWLQGEIEYEHRQTAADRRADIRDRVSSALQDFELLNESWSGEERQKMVDDLEDPEQVAADMIEFLYVMLCERSTDAEEMLSSEARTRALGFRSALTQGIKQGKQNFGENPGFALIDSNVELFELPTIKQLERALDTMEWAEANEYVQEAVSDTDDEVIDRTEAAKKYDMKLHLLIEEELYRRRGTADSEIKRHDQMVAASGPKLIEDSDENE